MPHAVVRTVSGRNRTYDDLKVNVVEIDLENKLVHFDSVADATKKLSISFRLLKVLAYPSHSNNTGGPSLEEIEQFYNNALAGFPCPGFTVKVVTADGEVIVGRLKRGELGRFPLLIDMDRRGRNHLMLITNAETVAVEPDRLREQLVAELKSFVREKIPYIKVLALVILTVAVVKAIEFFGSELELSLAKTLIRLCSTIALLILFVNIVLDIASVSTRVVFRKAKDVYQLLRHVWRHRKNNDSN